jgi:hypothetical protein
MPINYGNLAAPNGQDENMGGLTQRIYFAPISDFLVIQKPTVGTTFASKSAITAAHTFKPTKYFNIAYSTADKGKVDGKGQGEQDGKSFKQEGEFFYPGSKAEAHGFASAAKNDNFILLCEMPDSDTNGLIQVGTEMFPAKIEPEFTSATNSAGVRGYMFKFTAMTPTIHVYSAAVTVAP